MEIRKNDLLKFIEILENEVSIYKKLLSIEEEKSRAIKKADGLTLKNLTQDTDSEIKTINRLEDERNIFMNKIYPKKNQNTSIDKFLNILNSKDKKTIKKLVETLKTVVFTLKKKLSFNARMIEMKQDLITEILENYKKQRKLQVYSNKDSKESQKPVSFILNLTA